jgi:PadR family transcriptional regulator PadR
VPRNDQDIRLTQPTLKVLRFLLETPREGRSGAEMSKATKVGSGTLYPMLARLEAAGWLSSEWEAIDPSEAGRPRRRFYKLTGVGQNNAHAALVDLQMTTGELAWIS